MSNLIFKDEVYAIIGATMDVYNELRVGFLRLFIKKHWKSN
jgi:hypothetical protein